MTPALARRCSIGSAARTVAGQLLELPDGRRWFADSFDTDQTSRLFDELWQQVERLNQVEFLKQKWPDLFKAAHVTAVLGARNDRWSRGLLHAAVLLRAHAGAANLARSKFDFDALPPEPAWPTLRSGPASMRRCDGQPLPTIVVPRVSHQQYCRRFVGLATRRTYYAIHPALPRHRPCAAEGKVAPL